MHEVLCEEQHGFHPKRSCETQLISTINDFAECHNQGGQFNVLLLDFSKAFDNFAHTCLCICHKLHYYGIYGRGAKRGAKGALSPGQQGLEGPVDNYLSMM